MGTIFGILIILFLLGLLVRSCLGTTVWGCSTIILVVVLIVVVALLV